MNDIKAVEYYELDRWGWECPSCGHWHEVEEEPKETVGCEGGCLKKYKPIPDF